eukprot:g46506.t1
MYSKGETRGRWFKCQLVTSYVWSCKWPHAELATSRDCLHRLHLEQRSDICLTFVSKSGWLCCSLLDGWQNALLFTLLAKAGHRLPALRRLRWRARQLGQAESDHLKRPNGGNSTIGPGPRSGLGSDTYTVRRLLEDIARSVP